MNVNVPKQERSPTQTYLADQFGVSRMTVSRALRRSALVRADLAEEIRKAAEEQGYSHEAGFSARLLRKGQNGTPEVTNVIGVVTRDTEMFAGPFQLRLLNGVKRGAEQCGDELIVAFFAERTRLPRVVLRRQLDGLIWLSSRELEFFPAGYSAPMVGVFYTLPGADLVAVDDHGAMRPMGEYLARKGHRRVAFVGPDSDMAWARLAGLRVGLAGEGGLVDEHDVRMARNVMLPETVTPLVRAAMAHRQTLPPGERFTAMAAYNDFIAVTVLRCLQDEHGLRVPQDISVTGFDGLDLNAGAGPKLATVAMPLEDLGTEAARLIHWRMEHRQEPARRVILPAPLVEGESVGEAGVEK